jgi:hypothetical protein
VFLGRAAAKLISAGPLTATDALKASCSIDYCIKHLLEAEMFDRSCSNNTEMGI